MEKGKKIKELDDWLKNADSHVFDIKENKNINHLKMSISIMILIVFH